MTHSFRSRSNELEIMDDLDLDGPKLRNTLDQLAVVNKWLGGETSWKKVWKMIPPSYDQTITIADLGCGDGRALRVLAKQARKKGLSVQFFGFDGNPHAIAYAWEQSKAYPEITYETADVTHASFLNRRFDVVTCCLFLHHFPDDLLQTLIPAYMHMSNFGLLITDLQRHWLPHTLFNLITRVLNASHMVRHDGLLSIRRGFHYKELDTLLQLTRSPYQIRWIWAFRYLVMVSNSEKPLLDK